MNEHNRQYWEDMYQTPIDELPWEIKEAPPELKEYLDSNTGSHGNALDAGCGTGNFSIYLAQKGYKVTGADYSEKAIAIAAQRAAAAGLDIEFRQADLVTISLTLDNIAFDLILDYKVSHHLPKEQLQQYVAQCVRLLNPRGRILLVCYSEKDKDAQGNGSAVGKYGNVMFYRTADEIRTIYGDLKEVSYKEAMLGKHLNHAGHCFVFEKE